MKLADLHLAKMPRCSHCELELTVGAPVEEYAPDFVIVFCLKCNCSSVFRLAEIKAIA